MEANPQQMPVFLFLSGQNADDGREVLINLNLIRMVKVESHQVVLSFSETHHVTIPNGAAANEILGFLGMHAVMTNGMPFPEAETLRRQMSSSEPSANPSPEA